MTQYCCTRYRQPERTGTPPLLQTAGSDGLFVAHGVWTPAAASDRWADAADEDPSSALAGMARFATVSGATITTSDDVDASEGHSLVNIALARHDADDATIRNVRLTVECAKSSPPYVFSFGDGFYVGKEHCPYIVKRIGFGEYLQEIRIIRVGETDSYSVGKWVHHQRLYSLEVGDILEVASSLTNATQ